MNRLGFFPFLSLALVAGPTPGLPAGHDVHLTSHPIMHLTADWMKAHQGRRAGMPVREATPAEFYAQQAGAVGDTLGVDLLNHINFNSCGGVQGWDQGECGNCWVFGSTAALSLDYGVATAAPELFSTQWFDSDYYATDNSSVCNGGDSSTFASWYNDHPKFIPWTNTNAGYADGNGPSTPAEAASAIAQSPSVAITGLTVAQIATQNVSQAQAIANIKAVLDKNEAVVLSYFLPGAGWTDFDNAWDSNSETTPWAGVDAYSGTTMDANGGGHLVCVVGYDNTNSSWVILNSWGTTSGRPDGYFELPQAMGYGDTMNYDGTMNQYEFDVYEPTGWPSSNVTAPTLLAQPASQTVAPGQTATFTVSAGGSAPLTYQWYQGTAALSGATGASYTTPAATAAESGTTFHVKVTNAAGSVTSSNATLTVSSSVGGQLIVNGGFEDGATGWTASPGVIARAGSGNPAYAGSWDAWFGGTSAYSASTLSQTVQVPATLTSATLTFHLLVQSKFTRFALDTFKAEVRDSAGTVLATLASFSNKNASSSYQTRTFDLSAYKGQTIQVYFTNSLDWSHETSFVLDNVSLEVQ